MFGDDAVDGASGAEWTGGRGMGRALVGTPTVLVTAEGAGMGAEAGPCGGAFVVCDATAAAAGGMTVIGAGAFVGGEATAAAAGAFAGGL